MGINKPGSGDFSEQQRPKPKKPEKPLEVDEDDDDDNNDDDNNQPPAVEEAAETMKDANLNNPKKSVDFPWEEGWNASVENKERAATLLANLVYSAALGIGIGLAVYGGVGLLGLGITALIAGGSLSTAGTLAGTLLLGSLVLAPSRAEAAPEDGGAGYSGAPDGALDILVNLIGDASQMLSPLVLDLDGDGVRTTTVNNGIYFDHDLDELPDGSRHRMTKDENFNHSLLPDGAKIYRLKSLEPSGKMDSGMFKYEFEGTIYKHPKNGYATSPEGMDRLKFAARIQPKGSLLNQVLFTDDNPMSALTVPWYDTIGADDKMYVVQTNTEIVKRCILMTTDPGDLVLDPTCGGGTTAYVAEQWGRRWITCDTSRVALSLARQRLMASRFPFYLLADSKEGSEKETEQTGILPSSDIKHSNDIRKGFVYERVPHVTLKSIANNPDIKEGMNKKEIEIAIARHADTETLYDRPYALPERQKIRVTGPFTMESLSPHRVLVTDTEQPESEMNGKRDNLTADFATLVIDNLRKAGVQNTHKKEKLKFDSLLPYAGRWLHATGTYTNAEGQSQKVAVSIGPEHGTVGPDQIREAAKEAVEGIGFELLIICGYAFDPLVGEESKKYGRLTVLPTRMNADLSMGDELLKKTGTGNLFMVFGEPEIKLHKESYGRFSVEISGVDIYDPTTGEIRSSSTDEIACWFIDSNYNEESFFVRHAYFTGAGDPYQKLKKTLRAEIDEEAWSALYQTRSLPFPKPKTGKFAVKVINHYGDEVLKIFNI